MIDEHIVCLNPSKQGSNIGVDDYGTEKDNAHIIGYRVKDILDWNGGFKKAYCTPKTMTLSEGIKFSNDVKATIHVDIHSNAWMYKNRGCQACYKSAKGKALAKCIYDEVASVTPTADEGLKYRDDLGALNQTNATAALVEMFYHDNYDDVEFYKNHKEEFARAIAAGIMKYAGVPERQETVYKTVTATQLNVRDTPSAASPDTIIGHLNNGDKVHVGFEKNGWANIFFGNNGGWVSSAYLK